MSNTSVVHPLHYLIVNRVGTTWYFKSGEVFYNHRHVEIQAERREERFGLSKSQVAIELFRINGGKPGYYIANLRDRKYYYCGTEVQDVKDKLLSLGIGRPDPVG